MMMVTATQIVVGLITAIGRLVMRRRMVVVHRGDREIICPLMIVRHHEGRRMLDLGGRLGGHCRRIEHHQRHAERRDHAVDCTGGRCWHTHACSCGPFR